MLVTNCIQDTIIINMSVFFLAGAVKTEGEEDGAAKSPPDKSEDMDKAMHLPPKQRQLFMRILHQQHNARLQAAEEAENKGSTSAEDDASQLESKSKQLLKLRWGTFTCLFLFQCLFLCFV